MIFTKVLEHAQFFVFLKGFIFIVVGYLLAKYSRKWVTKLLKKYLEAQHRVIVEWLIFYLILGLFVITALDDMGFSLSVLLGAAGIVSVAIGFASQTAASNLISGLFLIGERPFSIGDVIKVDQTLGEVVSIDLLSIKLRTFDNLFVRIPNESVIKSQTTTLTKYPIRRFDFVVGVAYKEDLEKVRDILIEVADKNPVCLNEPKPTFIIDGFADSSINIKFCVWSLKQNYLELRNSMYINVKKIFDEQGIEIPFPHLSLYTGTATSPFPIDINPDKKKVNG
ncbi:MAG: mechanosensitive ion channel family protein [Nitrospinae bacterium]|nr:mechanosensitive ion channel family protein [Nitrospinota bacterium]